MTTIALELALLASHVLMCSL